MQSLGDQDTVYEDIQHKDPADREQTRNVAADDVVVESDNALLTVHAATRQAGVSRAAVLSWIRNGFIEASTSSDGWLVRAGDIEQACRNADDARSGQSRNPKERENARENGADLERIAETTSAVLPVTVSNNKSADVLSDAFLAPLAEFVRDQADIVQEQAETIGWLQAELRRARELLQVNEIVPQDEAIVEEAETAESSASPEMDLFANGRQPVNGLEAYSNVIAEDPFSEEAAHARMLFEETERKIDNMWAEQEERRTRRMSAPEPTRDEISWLKWLKSPLKRRES